MPRPSPWDLDFADSRRAAQKHLGHNLEILRPLIRFSHEYLREIRDVSATELDQAIAMAFRNAWSSPTQWTSSFGTWPLPPQQHRPGERSNTHLKWSSSSEGEIQCLPLLTSSPA